MRWEVVVVSALAGVAAALAVLRWNLRERIDAGTVSTSLAANGHPRWASWLSRLGDASVSRWLPLRSISMVDRLDCALQRADLDDAIDARRWVGASLSIWVGVGLLAGLLATPIIGVGVGLAAALWPLAWMEGRRQRMARAVTRDLPGLLDLMSLAVEAGCALPSAITLATRTLPQGLLRSSLERALREVRAGRPSHEAWRDLAVRCRNPGVDAFIAALVQAEATGISIGGLLRAHSLQRQEERFARAEKAAMKAPVKLLLPLVACIFPCAFLVIGFPIAHRLMNGM